MSKNDQKVNSSTSLLMENLGKRKKRFFFLGIVFSFAYCLFILNGLLGLILFTILVIIPNSFQVDGVLDNDVDVDDPIIKYLVKNEGWNDKGDSDDDLGDLASDESDIEVLIEEHILLEKLKQVRGKKHNECETPENNSYSELDEQDIPSSILGTANGNELFLMKTKIEEAMQINLKTREELLSMEKNLIQKYQDAFDRKQEKNKEFTVPEAKWKFRFGPERFIDSFRSPYFKCNGSVAPCDPELEKIQRTNISLISLSDEWRASNIESLRIAVRKFLILEQSQLKREAMKRNGRLDPIRFSFKNLLRLKNGPLYELVKDRDADSLDWKYISTHIRRPATERECQQVWNLLIKPSLKEWTTDELKRLVDIANAYKLQNWDGIAKELNTGRSGYECFHQHQGSYILEWAGGKWTKDEEEHLAQIVEMSKIGNFISWDKVTYFMDTKFAEQIYAKWHGFQAPHITKGPFTEREDRILLGMIIKFGADLKSVAAVLKNRSIAQLTARYKDHLLPQLRLKVGEWTAEEDEKLLQLVKEHGEANWATIAKDFETRSRVQIRHRFRLLKQKLTNNPNLNLKMIHRPKRPTSKKRICKNRLFYSKIISSKGKHIKSLLKDVEVKQNKRKQIDMKLTQYYQMKFATHDINETTFSDRFEERKKDNISEDAGPSSGCPLKVDSNKSLLSYLIYSTTAYKNLIESATADGWSQKDRSNFSKGILELCTTNKENKEDLFKWHKVFCALFSAPALLSHLDVDKDWKKVLPNV